MPGRDGTGPDGMGPMTGRGLGNCADDTHPGFIHGSAGAGRHFSRGAGYGRGYGRGGRSGAGWRHYAELPSRYGAPVAGTSSSTEEIEQLRERVQALEKLLAAGENKEKE